MISETASQSKAFLDDARHAVHGLRRALADVLAAVDANPDQPQELSRRFGLDKTLTWRIARVIRAEDPSEAVPHIPRGPSMRIFARAMTKHGAPAKQVDSVIKAVKAFEQFVEVHSGDRETLEMMLGASPKRSAAKRMETFRKQGFQANSAIWGVRARAQVAVRLLAPGTAPGMVSLATITGLVEFRRLRPDVPWAIATVHTWNAQGESDDPTSRRELLPLDASAGASHELVLRRFSSEPLPAIDTTEDSRGTRRYMLGSGAVGNMGAATILSGWLTTNTAPMRGSFEGECGEHGVNLTTPVEEVIADLLVHRDLKFAMNPTAEVYSQLPGGPRFPSAPAEAAALPVPTELVDLGSPPDTTTPELPVYGDLAQLAAKRMGHDLSEFRGFRYRLKYPPIPAMAVIRHGLLPPE